MRPPVSARLLVACLTLLAAAAAACGEEEPEPTPQERCAADGPHVYTSGFVEDADARHDLSYDQSMTRGRISAGKITLYPGVVETLEGAPAVILRFVDTGDPDADLIDEWTNRYEADSAFSLDVVDASSPSPGEAARSSLETFDCASADDLICAQLAIDTSDNDVPDDEDAAVYNAAGGQVDITEIDAAHKRLWIQFSLELGGDVLEADDESTGQLEGCLALDFTRAGNGWDLE